MKQKNLFFLIILCLYNTSCKKNDFPTNKIAVLGDDSFIQLKNWMITGPFYLDTNDSLAFETFERNDFSIFNMEEEEITASQLLNLNTIYNLKNMDIVNGKFEIQHDHIAFNELIGNHAGLGNIYTSCILYSECQQKAALLIGSNAGNKIWLNNKPVYSKKKHKIRNYDSFVVVNLQKGKNFLLVKINKIKPTKNSFAQPKFVLDISSIDYAKKIHYLQNENNILQNSIINTEDTIYFVYPLYEIGDTIKIKLFDVSNNELRQSPYIYPQQFILPIGDLNGLYKIDFNVNNTYHYKQDILIGDGKSILKSNTQDVQKFMNKDDRTTINLNAQLIRYKHLLEHEPKVGRRIAYFDIAVSNNRKNWDTVYSGASSAFLLHKGKVNIGSVNARYLKIIGRGTSSNAFVTICETALYDTDGKEIKVNSIDASSHINDKYAKNAVDKDIKTHWCANGIGNWFEFDIGREAEIGSVNIAWLGDYTDEETLREWQRKLVYSASELQQMNYHLQNGINPFKNVPGTHIRAFRSVIDNSPQYYMMHVPVNMGTKSLPLLVYLPIAMSSHYEFIKSVRLANITLTQRLANEANRYGFAIIRPCCRIYEEENLSPVGIKDIFEAFEDMQKDYNIDSNKIFLGGICAGAQKALTLATKIPDKFAGAGCVAAITGPSLDFPKKERWYQNNKLHAYAGNLSQFPLIFYHGSKDNHSPFAPVKTFVETARQKNVDATLKVIEDATISFYDHETFDELFSFFSSKKRNEVPEHINYSTAELKYNKAYWIEIDQKITDGKCSVDAIYKNDSIEIETDNISELTVDLKKLARLGLVKSLLIDKKAYQIKNSTSEKLRLKIAEPELSGTIYKNTYTEGPINHIFLGPCIIVHGKDKGSPKGASIFQADWKGYYFSEFLMKKDDKCTDDDLRNNNLILFGDSKTNSILSKIKNKIPIQYSTHSFNFKGDDYSKPQDAICCIYPNPYNPQKYIIIVSTNNWDKFAMFHKNIAINGIHDYVVWRTGNKTPEFLTMGYFNAIWE